MTKIFILSFLISNSVFAASNPELVSAISQQIEITEAALGQESSTTESSTVFGIDQFWIRVQQSVGIGVVMADFKIVPEIELNWKK